MISLKNLIYEVDHLRLLDSVDINIPKGKITVLVGSNGAGKTTILRLLAGVVKPTKGDVLINRKEVFYLPQNIKYPTGITLAEYLESYFYKNSWKWFTTKEEKNKISETLKLLELADKSETLVENLSSGELQKANIALGLISDAKIFLLDEPTANMDLINQIKVLEIIKKLAKNGISCVIVLHDLNLSANYGDFFVGITKEHKIITADKNDFITAQNLNKIFGINFKVITDEKAFHIQLCN